MTERSALVDAIVRTLWLALRRARRAPGFTASVVMILALGIGANAVMFEVVDRLLLSPPATSSMPRKCASSTAYDHPRTR